MGHVRAFARAMAVAALLAGVFLSWGTVRILMIGAPVRRLAWRRRIFRAWAKSTLWALGAQVEILGTPPTAPALLVCNHQSYVDIPLLVHACGAVFVAKSEVADWPVIGYLSAQMGTIFLQRERKRDLPQVNDRIAEALDAGEIVVLFPEGTSTGGEEVLPFRPSLLEPAVASGYPVACAALAYATPEGEPPSGEAVCWWGDMTFGRHILRLLRMSHFQARVVVDPQPFRETDRKLLAERTGARVAELHASLRTPSA